MSDGHPIVIRLFDRYFGALMRPGVRRARRWAFVVTIAAVLLLAHSLGLRPRLQDGLFVGLGLVAIDLIVLLAVIALGTRLLGRERRDVLLDLLIHPVARRVIGGEWRLLGVYPRALLRRLRPTRTGAVQLAYHRSSSALAIAIAMLPPMAAETAVIHLLLPADWLIPRLVLLVLSAYGAIVLVGLAIGERVHPHELTADSLELRCGTLYRASIPLRCIASVTRRRERPGGHSGLSVDGEGARLTIGGRTDLELTLREPVEIERPIGEPVAVTRIAFAADDPGDVEAALASPPPARAKRARSRGWLASIDALDGVAA